MVILVRVSSRRYFLEYLWEKDCGDHCLDPPVIPLLIVWDVISHLLTQQMKNKGMRTGEVPIRMILKFLGENQGNSTERDENSLEYAIKPPLRPLKEEIS